MVDVERNVGVGVGTRARQRGLKLARGVATLDVTLEYALGYALEDRGYGGQGEEEEEWRCKEEDGATAVTAHFGGCFAVRRATMR